MRARVVNESDRTSENCRIDQSGEFQDVAADCCMELSSNAKASESLLR